MQQPGDNNTATEIFEWPRPLSTQALKAVKAVLLGVLILTALVQIVPFQLLGGLANHVFTIILILSWVGPARRLLGRRAAERNARERNDGSASADG